MKVYLVVKNMPDYPYNAIEQGFKAHNNTVINAYPEPTKNDFSDCVIVTWNFYGKLNERMVNRVIQGGGKHIVFENGYLSPLSGNRYYAINNAHHLEIGSQRFDTDPSRFDRLNLTIKEYDKNSVFILVCAQRGGKYSDLAMPRIWPEQVIGHLRKITDLPIIYRPHPEKKKLLTMQWDNVFISKNISLVSDLNNAKACIIYTSNAGNHALLNGVPVFYCGAKCACQQLALTDISRINNPLYPTYRRAFFAHLLNHQYTENEIKRGTAWDYMKTKI